MTFELGQTLYAPTKTGNVKTWCCNVQEKTNDQAPAIMNIVTQTKLDGKPVVRQEVIMAGKNIGRSNETTPYEQAISEAESRYRKKLDQGYKTEIPADTSKANENALGLPKPMLAHPIDKVKEVEFPAYWQPKLNGHRCLVTKQGGKMLAYSRQGKLITSMDHILHHLEDKVEEGMFLDGELYVHGEILQNIGSFIKKKQEGSERVRYHVYDMMLALPYAERWQRLRNLLKYTGDDNPPAFVVPTVAVPDMETAQKMTDGAIADGYEGGILRTPDNGYLAGFRSRQLLKMKKFDDAEFAVVDIIQGKTRNVNDISLEVAILVCETQSGKRFEVTAHGDMREKDRIWHERDNYIGRLVTVKYYDTTKDGIPFHSVALQWFEPL